jgi:hypothetical protein
MWAINPITNLTPVFISHPYTWQYGEFEVFTAGTRNSTKLWDITTCSQVEIHLLRILDYAISSQRLVRLLFTQKNNNVTDSTNALPGNSSVNTVQYAAIEEAMFSADPTNPPVDWLDNDHVIYVYVGPYPFRGCIIKTVRIR